MQDQYVVFDTLRSMLHGQKDRENKTDRYNTLI